MSSCGEESVSVRSSCISHSFTDQDKHGTGEKIQDLRSTEKPKINRLRRAKRSQKSDLISEGQGIRPEVSDHDDDDDQKCSHTSTVKTTRPPHTHSAQGFPSDQGLHMKTAVGQNKLEIKSDTIASSHQQPSVLTGQDGSLRRSGPRAEKSDLQEHEENGSENITMLKSDSRSTPGRLQHQRSTGFFKDVHTREEMLKQVHTQNPRFPVRRLFQTLLKRHVSQCPSGGGESVPVIFVAGKRKPEVESLSDGSHGKRQRSSQDDLQTHVNTSQSHVSSGHRNRLRRKQTCVQKEAVGKSCQDEGRVGQGGDVPWTEKYRPRSSDEVIGNSAAVKKLYSWLKEWRIRADVEERRRRQEERRRKTERDGSWDCGDFEGDPLIKECEGELCNTLLIHGPTGVGKSAAVFACAEQLGFKVLEVNSSSLRSGHLVLSQLRESTQSHQVGAPQRSVFLTHTPVAASRDEAPQKSIFSCRKLPPIPRAASGKKRGAVQTTATLTRYFRKTGQPVNKHTKLQDMKESWSSPAADEVTLDQSEFQNDGVLDRKDKTAPISLILFEEVDVIFEEDVGFLTAVKSLMKTTKRPIILTTNDPLFGESFDGHFEEIHFKTPSVENVVSYLQCVCVVQSVKLDPEHIRFMLQENEGDVRRSVLELEMWVRSGAGNTRYNLHNRALTCRSYTELESSSCVELLVKSWRKGRSLLHSNLDLLLAPPTTEKADQSTFKQNTICTVKNKLSKDPSPSSSRKCSRLSVKRDVFNRKNSESALPLDRVKQMNQSAPDTEGFSKVVSLARFFDTMSFADSYLSRQPSCKSGPLGARTADGLLDEPREEEDMEIKTHSLERCYEILAVVEGLGFHRCRMEVCPVERGDQDVAGGDKNKIWKLSEQKMGHMVHRVLCSKAFQYHGNQTAVLTDYLPCVRFICRQQDTKQQKLGFSHYLRDIGLPKSILKLLASPLH